jgi:hypothetical protein
MTERQPPAFYGKPRRRGDSRPWSYHHLNLRELPSRAAARPLSAKLLKFARRKAEETVYPTGTETRDA